MEENKEPIGLATQQQIDGWKKQHGEVHPVEYRVDNEDRISYFREAKRDEYAYMLALSSNFDQCSELAKQTYLGGDDLVLTDWKLQFSAGQTLLEVNAMPATRLGKL